MKTTINKRRWTWQREVLLRLLREARGHLDADELYRKAREICPRIGLSTVYRNLRLFRDLGLIKELQLGEGHSHYEFVREGEHQHFLCRRCGRVIEFSSLSLKGLREELELEHGVRVEVMELRLEGLCRDCLKERGDDARQGSSGKDR
ncbi:MAG: transcriptional repressor [Deltaproteobacteria bacterium]|nr:MAG: transcriptional repressor [Deltaproteobacteria bacterium]